MKTLKIFRCSCVTLLFAMSAFEVSSETTYKVIGAQIYMAAESSLLFGTKWVPRRVDGIAILENGSVTAQWDELPKAYPADWVTDMGGGDCRVAHDNMPQNIVFTYRVSDGVKFYEINTNIRKKSYMKFKCSR
jgi:hypothetical protein